MAPVTFIGEMDGHIHPGGKRLTGTVYSTRQEVQKESGEWVGVGPVQTGIPAKNRGALFFWEDCGRGRFRWQLSTKLFIDLLNKIPQWIRKNLRYDNIMFPNFILGILHHLMII
jgi:hypothetical protein